MVTLTEPAHAPLVVHRHCRIMVVVSSSDATHYPSYTTEPFEELGLPWVKPVFIDESRFARQLKKELAGRFAGIYITNGALAMAEVREALRESGQHLREFLEAGGGLVVSGRSFMQDDEVDLDFIPGQFPIALFSSERRNFCNFLLQAPAGHRPLTVDKFKIRSGNDWTDLQVTTQTAYDWESLLVVEDHESGLSQPVVLKSQFGIGRIIVSVLPLELLENAPLLNELVREAVRGCTHFIYSTNSDIEALQRAAPGTAVVSIATTSSPDSAVSLEDAISIASRVSVEGEVDWSDVNGLNGQLVLEHLENCGAIDFMISGPAHRVHCRVEGLPRYLQILRSAEDRISPVLPDLATGLTFNLFAFAMLCRVANDVVRSPPQLPRTYRMEQLRHIVQIAVLRRFHAGSVDGLLLPTVALACASHLAGLELPGDCVDWVRANSPLFSDDHRAQAQWYCRLADCRELEDAVCEPQVVPSSLPGRLAQSLRRGEKVSMASVPESPLDQAVHAISTSMFDRIGPEFYQNGRYRDAGISVEALCFFVAAEVRRASEEPLEAGGRATSKNLPVIPDVSGMLKERLRVELDNHQLDPIRLEHVQALAAGRRVLAVLAGLVALVAAGLVTYVGTCVATAAIDIPTGITLTGVVLASVLALLAVVASSPPLRLIAPRFVMRLHELWVRAKLP